MNNVSYFPSTAMDNKNYEETSKVEVFKNSKVYLN
jgi:hypothetical protein